MLSEGQCSRVNGKHNNRPCVRPRLLLISFAVCKIGERVLMGDTRMGQLFCHEEGGSAFHPPEFSACVFEYINCVASVLYGTALRCVTCGGGVCVGGA